MMHKIPVINGLRGIAILAVIHHHLWGDMTVPGWHGFTIGGLSVFPFTILSNGYEAVMLFFFLSGFVLALPYMDGRRTMASWNDVRNFYERRASRLLPLLAVVIVIAALLITGWHPQAFVRGMVQMVIGIVTPVSANKTWFLLPSNWVLWSIRVELWLSVLMPAAIILQRRFGTTSFLLSALILQLAIRWIAVPWGETGRHVIGLSVIGQFDYFLLGMALAALFVRQKSLLSPHRNMLLGSIFILTAFWLSDFDRLQYVFSEITALRFLLLVIGMFLVCGWLLVHKSVVRSVLEFAPLQWIGVMCYSVYVWHGALFHPLGAGKDLAHAMMYVAVLLPISILSYFIIERGLWKLYLPMRVTSSSVMFAFRKFFQVFDPPSTRIDEMP
jgi:peptidoglycan/LPS O-acetylase OafA/YrhL